MARLVVRKVPGVALSEPTLHVAAPMGVALIEVALIEVALTRGAQVGVLLSSV